MIVFLFLKEHDLPVPLRQHSQGRRLHTAHIQGFVIEDGKKTGGVNADQPVSFLAAEG